MENSSKDTLKDPFVLAAGSLVVGFYIGSGRIQQLGQTAGRILGSLGMIGIQYLTDSLRTHNPALFSEESSGSKRRVSQIRH